MLSNLLLRNQIKKIETPANRDRSIDAVRAYGLIVVVAGHYLMGIVHWNRNVPQLGNSLSSSLYLQAITWIFQVMPLFFIAGGAANFISWKSAQAKETSYAVWLWKRAHRLLSPALVYLFVMITLGSIISPMVNNQMSRLLLNISTQLLWFLGVYIVTTALTPFTVKLFENFRWGSIFAWLVFIGLCDYAQLGGTSFAPISLLNFISVWAMVSQLGYAFEKNEIKPRNAFYIFAISIAIEIWLVYQFPYPMSLVGLPDEMSNMAPPTLVLSLHSIVIWSLLSIFKDRINRLCQNQRLWNIVAGTNMAAMTVYLWHIPIIMFVTVATHFAGLDRTTYLLNSRPYPGEGYWLQTVPFLLVSGCLVYWFVQIAWSLEHIKVRWWQGDASNVRKSSWRGAMAIVGVFLIGTGLLAVAGTGLHMFPNGTQELSGVSFENGQAAVIFIIGIVVARLAISSKSKSDFEQ
jgi:hypothetical protein